MAGDATYVGAVAALDYLTGRALKYGAPFNTYLALLTATPDLGATLDQLAEVNTAGYARQQITWSPASAATPPTATSNSSLVTFGPFTANMPVPVTDAVLVTAQTGTVGDVLYWWSLNVPQQSNNGQSLQIAPGALVMTLT